MPITEFARIDQEAAPQPGGRTVDARARHLGKGRIDVAGAAARARRPAIGVVAVALAVPAAILSDHAWAVVVAAACAWWWGPRSSNFAWLGGLAAGLAGTVWAMLGADALSSWPDRRLLTGILWAGSAALAAGAAWIARRSRPEV